MVRLSGDTKGPVFWLAMAVALGVAVPASASEPGQQPRPYEGPLVPPQPRVPDKPRAPGPEVTRPRSAVVVPKLAIEPANPVRVRPVLDLTITIGAAAPGLALGLWVEPALPDNVPDPGAEPRVVKMDEIALGRFERAPAVASDVLLAVTLAAPFAYHLIEAAVRRRGFSTIRGRGFLIRYGTDLIILSQALAFNALLTEVLKTAIRRPRPYTYLDPADVDPSLRDDLVAAQMDNNSDWSFPSGHTSTAFVIATAGATLLTLELLGRSKWAIAAAWIGGLGAASAVAVLRVAAGRHFPSDVLTSAFIGMGIGAAVPLAHWRPPVVGDYVARERPDRRWALMPTAARDYRGATLVWILP